MSTLKLTLEFRTRKHPLQSAINSINTLLHHIKITYKGYFPLYYLGFVDKMCAKKSKYYLFYSSFTIINYMYLRLHRNDSKSKKTKYKFAKIR